MSCDSIYMKYPQQANLRRRGADCGCRGLGGGECVERLRMGSRFLWGRVTVSYSYTVALVAQRCGYVTVCKL